jgi:hypothetical protein
MCKHHATRNHRSPTKGVSPLWLLCIIVIAVGTISALLIAMFPAQALPIQVISTSVGTAAVILVALLQ